jgi:hypothetical protein
MEKTTLAELILGVDLDGVCADTVESESSQPSGLSGASKISLPR